MQSFAAASLLRLSETVPKLFVFETACYAFCGLESVASSCKLFLLMYNFIIIIDSALM